MYKEVPYISSKSDRLLHADDVLKHEYVKNRLGLGDAQAEVACDLFPNLTAKEMEEQLDDILFGE